MASKISLLQMDVLVVRRLLGRIWRRANRSARSVAKPLGSVRDSVKSFRRRQQLARQPRRLAAIASSRAPVTLFLSPEAGLEPYHASHVMLAKTLDDAGHAAIVLSCDGLLPICTVKFATRTGATSWNDRENPVCVACRAVRQKTADDYGLLEISLESLVDSDDAVLIDKIIKRFEKSPWTAEYDAIEFGTIALAEVLRDCRKHAAEELNDDDIRLLVALLRSSLAVYLALQKLAERFNLNQIAYLGEYAYWQPVQIMAARRGFGLLALAHGYHRDIDRRRLSIRPRHAMVHMLEQIDDWPAYQDRPIPAAVVTEIASGALYRLSNQGGASNYSPTWSDDSAKVFEELGLSRDRRTIVAYPSSYDEYVCVAGQLKSLGHTYPDRPQPFADQEAWMRQLVQWVSRRSDLQLVLRMHPRMGVGHRHSTLSSDYRKLKEAFSSVPANVVVVWPESRVSSYSLAEFADVALISWSSMGLELARFGIPVVSAFQRVGPVPLSDFIRFELETDRYFAAVESALDEAATVEKIVGAFRWTHYLHWASLIDVSDIVPNPDYPTIPAYRQPRQRALMLEMLVNRADVTQLNMARLDRSAAACKSERVAILQAIETFVGFFDAAALASLASRGCNAVGPETKQPTRLVKRLIDLLQNQRNEDSGAMMAAE